MMVGVRRVKGRAKPVRLKGQGLGEHRLVSDLDPQDFAALKNKLAAKNGPARMGTIVQVIRSAFKFAFESGLIDKPVRFGPVFRRSSKKTLRLHRAKQGPRLFSADEVRKLTCTPAAPSAATAACWWRWPTPWTVTCCHAPRTGPTWWRPSAPTWPS
jgi:hypothetical protein